MATDETVIARFQGHNTAGSSRCLIGLRSCGGVTGHGHRYLHSCPAAPAGRAGLSAGLTDQPTDARRRTTGSKVPIVAPAARSPPPIRASVHWSFSQGPPLDCQLRNIRAARCSLVLVTTGPAQARSVGACCRIREGYLTGKQEGVNGEKNKATAAKESADLSVRVPLLPPATCCLRGSVRCVIAARERGQQAPHLTGENVPLESRMSMYTQLLEAAFAQRSPTCAGPTERTREGSRTQIGGRLCSLHPGVADQLRRSPVWSWPGQSTSRRTRTASNSLIPSASVWSVPFATSGSLWR
jgi:hypothetical protein